MDLARRLRLGGWAVLWLLAAPAFAMPAGQGIQLQLQAPGGQVVGRGLEVLQAGLRLAQRPEVGRQTGAELRQGATQRRQERGVDQEGDKADTARDQQRPAHGGGDAACGRHGTTRGVA